MSRKKTSKAAAEAAAETVPNNDSVETTVTEATETPATDGAADAAEELAAAQAAASENRDLYLRALADLENYRKRAARDREDAVKFANDSLLREFIPVIDNLERALEHAGDAAEQKVLREGVEMTLVQFRKVLETAGVTEVPAAGSAFDPNFHQAMGQVETGEQPANTVVQVLQKGYLLRERLLRPALVMIAKAPAAASEDNATN